jgi:hypothetical protein
LDIQVYQYILIVALITAYINRKRNYVRYLIPFLVVVVFFELILGKLMKHYYGTNILSANVFVIICVLYYLYLFTYEFRRKWYWLLVSIYLCSILIGSFTQGFTTIMSFSYNIGMFLVLVVVFRYLYDLVIKDAYKPLYRSPLFWIALGIILFYSSLFPLLSFINRFMAVDMQFAIRLMDILSIGNIFLSLGYFGAIICQRNTKTLSTSSL